MPRRHLLVFLRVIVIIWATWPLAISTATAGTLDDVRARGHLICGVSEGLRGFLRPRCGRCVERL